MKAPFKNSAEAAFRKLVREVIRNSDMTKGEKAVTLAFVNLWFHHRNGPKGHIHPGREKLAKTAQVSVRTVASTLDLLRQAGVIVAIGRLHGEGQRPTQYKVRIGALFGFCGADVPEWIEGALTPVKAQSGVQSGVQFCTPKTAKWCAKIAHSLTDVGNDFSKGLRLVGGGHA